MIEDLRKKIDEVDEELVDLMNRRAEIALEIAEEKARENMEITDREREEEVMERIRRANDGPFSDVQLERVYRALISESKEIQTEVDANDSRNEARSN